ncbi:glycosyltransferase [Nocardia suismassiliense]|uniref:glycosyltransferase n=1 Tax=Nocardia suismassiliense TaxID=2077092 RepID=UPI000D1F831A|nr:glycosyltransferase [Nocardia suismassiliense]
MARYLVAVSPIPGHVAPMLAVAANLRRRGHEVRMLTGAAFRDPIAAQGLPCSVLPADAAVMRSGPAPDGTPSLIRRWRTGRSELRSGFLDPIVAQFRALTAELSRTDYDALLVAGDTADKPEVAARVAYTGAGIDLGTARPGPATVAAAVDRVLSSGEFRSTATRLGQHMAKAAPFDVISDVLAEVGADRSLTRMSASRNGECR